MRSFQVLGVTSVLTLTIFLFSPGVSFSQSTRVSNTNPDPAGTVDGAKTPELIPDHTAYLLIFRAIAEPEDANEFQKARARAKIIRAGLDENDTLAFLNAVTGFQRQLEKLDAEAAKIYERIPFPYPGHPNTSDWQKLVELDKKKELLITSTITLLSARLSAEGMRKLHAFVQEEKRGMKILPTTD